MVNPKAKSGRPRPAKGKKPRPPRQGVKRAAAAPSEKATARFTRDTPPAGKGAQPYRLLLLEGGPLATTYTLGEGLLTLGRETGNTLVLDAEGVSRHHASIEARRGTHLLTDLDSSNGVFVNRQRVSSHPLADGDLIFLGAASLKFLSIHNPEFAFYQQLHAASVVDALTGAYNRRYFDEALSREMERSRRYQRPMSLLFLDVDHFKAVNDAHGHPCGDHVLKELAEVVGARLRASEFVSRYGGEEFAVIAPETGAEGAARLAEALRAKVESHAFVFDGRRIPITVSIGAATWSPEVVRGQQLLALADARLFQAKRDGRNCCR